MKTILTFLTLSLVLAPRVAAQASGSRAEEQAAVVKIVQQFFDALHAKDGDRLRATCQPGAQFTSGRPAPEGYAVRSRSVETDIAHFAEAKEIWLERMWSPTVLIAGRIAVVWTRYDFHRDGKLSHNGTDCFTLIKTDAGWKIVCGAYSVEPGAKTENPAGPPR
jgi:hypothetical protein